MQYNRLGKTDLQVSQLCLGTMTFGEQNSEADGHRQLDYALDKGINFIDTAELYPIPRNRHTQGATERILGAWIRSRGQRERFVLASKIAGPSPGLSYIRDPLRFDEAQLRQALEGSLRRLQTDYLDLYQLHWPERTVNKFGKRHYLHRSGEDWAGNLQEMPRVASVFVNRLNRGMRLQADPTAVFARRDFDTPRVTHYHTKYDSPYNTYLYAGLPPGPISMASISSIDAVLNAETHDYIFFCAKGDGSGLHSFAETLGGHNQNVVEYKRNLQRRGLR